MEEVPRVISSANKQALANFSKTTSNSRKRNFALLLILPVLISGIVLSAPLSANAASGGRMGGGSFRSPSIPRTIPRSGGYRNGYGGAYRGGYRGGGIGFPFIYPIFGFGGGGLFGFLILTAIAGVIVNAIRGANFSGNPSNSVVANPESVKMIQLQIGLLASAKDLQQDLRRLASTADTNTPNGLQKILQETTLSILRQPELWVYANLEEGEVPFSSAESTFNRLSITERSKLDAELTSNYSGLIQSSQSTTQEAGEASETNEYIALTILLASRRKEKTGQSSTCEELKESLRVIGSISSQDLIALEVIWQPEGVGDVLTAENLVTAYPNLKHL